MRTLPVELSGREYKIEIGAGNLRDSLLSVIRKFDLERVVIVTTPLWNNSSQPKSKRFLNRKVIRMIPASCPTVRNTRTWKHSNGFTIS